MESYDERPAASEFDRTLTRDRIFADLLNRVELR